MALTVVVWDAGVTVVGIVTRRVVCGSVCGVVGALVFSTYLKMDH